MIRSLLHYVLICSFLTGWIQALSGQAQAVVSPKQDSLVALDEVFQFLEQQLNVHFNYEGSLIKSKSVATLPVVANKRQLDQQLRRLLPPLGLDFKKMKRNYYLIFPLEKEEDLLSSTSAAPISRPMTELINVKPSIRQLPVQPLPKSISHLKRDFSISGKVRGDDGEPLIGVNIIAKDYPGVGTTTNALGDYTLAVPNDTKVLVFSYIGYLPIEENIRGRRRINIVMRENAEQISEVVVIGYGESRKQEVMGAVDQIGSKILEKMPITSYNQALAGQVPGVQIRQTSGRPGGGPELLIRGIGSIGAGNQPLIVIDGLPYGNYNAEADNFMSLLDPNDIESISVIRDASGKAIYGSRAANGLILITTKRGRTGKPSIEVNTYTGYQQIPDWEKPDVMNATELANFHRERFEDDFLFRNGRLPELNEIPEQVRDPSIYGEGTDWFDELTQVGAMQNVAISLRGGSEAVKYNISAGYLNQTGTVINSEFQRYNLRANVDASINDWLSLGIELAPSWSDNYGGNIDPGSGQFSVYNTLNIARWADPTGRVYNDDGSFTRDTRGVLTQFYQVNPVKQLTLQQRYRNNRQILSGLNFTVKLLDGLTFKTYVAAQYLNNLNRVYTPADVTASGLEPSFTNIRSSATSGRYESLRLLSENTLNYVKDFAGGKHKVDLLAGYTAERQQETSLNVNSGTIIDENFTLVSSGNTARTDPNNPEQTIFAFGGGEGISEQALISYLGRAKYSFDDRYFVTATLRVDGSSRFGPNKRFAPFPSLGLGWRLSKENWLPDLGPVNNLRLYGSFGLSGNNRIGNYQWQGGVGGSNYLIGDQQVIGRFVGGIPNFDLTWEETEQIDMGLELGLWKDRLTVKVNYYNAVTEGLLFGAPLPRVTGFGSRLVNIGSIENRGWEVAVGAQPIIRNKLVWTIDANLTANRNKVLRLGPDGNPIFSIPAGNSSRAGITQVGSPIGLFYGLNITGLYTPEMIDDSSVPKYPGAVEGAPIYEDVNGDGVLDRSALDRTIIGNPWANFNFGLNTTLSYGDLSLRINSYGEVGSEILDLTREFTQNTDDGIGALLGVFNLDRQQLQRWRPGSTDFSVQPPTTATAASSQRWRWPNSSGVFDGTFWKISNVTLNYNLRQVARRLKGVEGGAVYVSIQNAAIFKSYYRNPEIRRSSAGVLERNVDYSSYPTARIYTVGLNIKL